MSWNQEGEVRGWDGQATYSHSNAVHEWWTVANIGGYPQKVYCTAANSFEAQNIFKSIYGSQLVNSYATRC
jgi:hypothetical protein